MCTVTYLPLSQDSFILTSNRDEGVKRKPALPPKIYEIAGKQVMFPKDGEAGGTWIGATPYGRVVCLMNGAFVGHKRELPYRMSRGQVVLDALTTTDVEDFLQNYFLEKIEPFTIVLFDWEDELQAWELRWDGKQRHLKRLPHEAQIWSSSTLYDNEMQGKREKWFAEWLSKDTDYQVNKIRNFHKTAGEGNPITDLRTERGFLRTVSVTTIEKLRSTVKMTYEDLRTETTDIAEFPVFRLEKV